MSSSLKPIEQMFKVEGLTTIRDSTVFEWFGEQLDLDERFPPGITRCANLVAVVEMEYDLPVAYIDHDSFIGDLTDYLESKDLIFTISVSLPFFSDTTINEKVSKDVMNRYGELSFLDNHLQMNHMSNPNRIELKYPLFTRYYNELLEKYPEAVV